MPTIELTSATLAYDERGSGPAVVFLPSGGHARSDYDALRALLPDVVRTIALDWPGHGDSPPPQGEASAMLFADVAQEAVERLAPEGAVVIGNSVGGFAAGRMAARRPDLVRGLVLVDSGGFVSPRSPAVRGFCTLMGRPRFLRWIYPRFSARYMRAQTDADRAARAQAIATTRRPEGLAVLADVWRSFAAPEHDLRAQAPELRMPTLVVWGRRDPVIPLKVGRAIAEAIPGAELVVLDTGHVPYTSDPEGVADVLRPFLDRVLASSASGVA